MKASSPINYKLPNAQRKNTNSSFFQFSNNNESSPSLLSPSLIRYKSNQSKFIPLMKNIFVLGITTIILMFLFYLLVINRDFTIQYCQKSEYSPKFNWKNSNFVQCPNYGTCSDGYLHCNPDYKNILGMCVLDNFEESEINQLFIEMAKYIASKIDNSCIKSFAITENQLKQEFSEHVDAINPAIAKLAIFGPQTQFLIKENRGNSSYTSYMPLLTAKCKCKVYIYRHITTICLLAIFIALTLILIHIILKKQALQRDIKNCSSTIVSNIKNNRKGDFRYSTDFSLSESNPLSKYWNLIVKEIENNSAVTILNSTDGKLWGHV